MITGRCHCGDLAFEASDHTVIVIDCKSQW